MSRANSGIMGKVLDWRLIATVLIMGMVYWLGIMGAFAPIDNTLRDLRFKIDSRAPTGEVVLVEIDPPSLAHFGVWPWPRAIHGAAIDALVEYGAYNIALDIDFSSHSNPENDAILAKALDDAGGFVILASFAQQSGIDGLVTFNHPIEEFAKNSWAASVNVAVDPDGRVRQFPYSSQINGNIVPSFPAALSGVENTKSAEFVIDYSIDAFNIDRISFLDVINGTVDPSRLANKNVIIGAGAVELRDNFAVSRYGVISGPMLQVLATETLIQGRELVNIDGIYSMIVIVIMGLSYYFLSQNYGFLQVVLGVVFGVLATESVSFYLQSEFGLLYNTGIIHVAQLLFVFVFLAFELERRMRMFKLASRQKAVTQSILNQVISDNFDGVVVVDQSYTIRVASGLAETMLNQDATGSLVGRLAKDVLPDELWAAVARSMMKATKTEEQSGSPSQCTLKLHGGSKVCLEYVVTRSIIDGSTIKKSEKVAGCQVSTVACLTFRDVTEQRKSAQKIKYIAHHDSITGALWRLKLTEDVADLLSTDAGLENGVTIGALDLRRFKAVNETLGHCVGDQLLRQVVERMRQSEIYLIGRLGGFSFTFSTAKAIEPEALEGFCNDLIANLCAPYHLDDHRLIIGVNIGVTDSFVSGPDPAVLLAHADIALSKSQERSQTSFCLYTHGLEEELLRKQEVEKALRKAIENGEFWVAYQPQVSLETGEWIGVEALIRWEHPEWGLMRPDLFIPVAEETGLIVEIGQWIMEAACEDAANWPIKLHLAVNVSALQFEFSDVCKIVTAALEKSGLPSDRLDIEITESSFVDNSQRIIDTLDAVRRMGVGVALDDFGTGYSSLSYLSRLPIDKIKVDQSFVRKLPADKETSAIVQSVLTLGDALNKKIVAEGIETQEQAEILRDGGAQIGQGYLFGKPMSDADLRGQMLMQFWQNDENNSKAAKAS